MLTIKKVIIYIIIEDNFIINCHSLLPLNKIAQKPIQVEEARDLTLEIVFLLRAIFFLL
jgi:hypothetical protein